MKTHIISSRRGFTLLELLIVLAIVSAIAYVGYSIWPKNRDSTAMPPPGGVQEVIKAEYSPPFIPVTLSVDTNGILKVKAEGQVVTPAGTFSVEWERQKIFYLEVTLGTETRFYSLGQNKFKIYIPNSLDNDTSVRYDGEGNVRILVPRPQNVRFPK